MKDVNMNTEANAIRIPLNWIEIWRTVFLHPTIKTFSELANNPQANMQWGIIWIVITSIITWLLGPVGPTLSGMVSQIFGRTYYFFLIAGAIVSPILSVVFFLVYAAIARGFARFFKGVGNFQKLVFCWAAIQLLFVLLAGLAWYIPSLFLSSHEFAFSRTGIIIQVTALLIALCSYLYLFYAQVVAFSAVENFEIGKGFGILLLQAIIIGIAGGCFFSVFQAMMMNSIRY